MIKINKKDKELIVGFYNLSNYYLTISLFFIVIAKECNKKIRK